MPRKSIIVIGAGLGGLSAAISLAQLGYKVTIHEKNPQIGGKLNRLQAHGYSFDLGPSILTLPHIFQALFQASGKNLSDYLHLRPVRPHWRNFFEDGAVVDLSPDPAEMARQAQKVGENPDHITRFLEYSAKLFDLVQDGYFNHGLDTLTDFKNHYGLTQFLQFDLFRSMHGGVKRFLHTPHMQDIFDYFIKYVGSSAYDAPAFMNCMATIQFRYDLWYVDGGLYQIALALQQLLDFHDITVHLQSEVVEVTSDLNRVTGITTRDGHHHPADFVVSNMEVIPAYEHLLHADADLLKSLERFQPSCSGLILDLGLDRSYPQLAHHNFFFSKHQKHHFHSVFHQHQLPPDPTIYLVAASKSDPSVAPLGCDGLKILPHIPPIDNAHPLTHEDYMTFKNQVLLKLERMGLTNLRQHVVFEHCWTPHDIRKQYASHQGSIYGTLTDRFKNFAFKAPKQSTLYPNLFFVGGSVNPGGGMPMVVLCGQKVAQKLSAWDALQPA